MTDTARDTAMPAEVGGQDDDTELMHRLVAEYGGHSVTIVRDGKRLIGWSTGRSASFAIADLREIVTSTALTTERDALEAQLAAERAAHAETKRALDALGAFAFWFQKYPEFKPNPDMQAEMLADLDRARPFIPARHALTGDTDHD